MEPSARPLASAPTHNGIVLRPKPDRRAQPKTPAPAVPGATPEDGDIVVREDEREGTLVYILHTALGTDHGLVRSRGEAVAQALVSAKTHGVRAWLTGQGSDFILVADFRAVTALRQDVRSRLHAEFLEMPGLRLKPAQVERLCGVERATCQMVLDALVDEKFLCVKSDGHYTRVRHGAEPPHFHPAKANLRSDRRIKTAS